MGRVEVVLEQSPVDGVPISQKLTLKTPKIHAVICSLFVTENMIRKLLRKPAMRNGKEI